MRGPANSQIIVRMTSACANRLARVLAGLVVAICLPASYAQNNAVSTGGASTMVHSMEDLQTSLPLMCKVRDHDTVGIILRHARLCICGIEKSVQLTLCICATDSAR